MSKWIIVGGGWVSTSKKKDTFVRLKFMNDVPKDTTLTMWNNKRKFTDKHPDYVVLAHVKDETNPDSPNEFGF